MNSYNSESINKELKIIETHLNRLIVLLKNSLLLFEGEVSEKDIEKYTKENIITEIRGVVEKKTKEYFQDLIETKIISLFESGVIENSNQNHRSPEDNIIGSNAFKNENKTSQDKEAEEHSYNKIDYDINIRKELIEILNSFISEETYTLSEKLKKHEIDNPLLKEIINIYLDYYNYPNNQISKEIEKILLKLPEFDIKITHPTMGFGKESAVKFEVISNKYLNDNITSKELLKIKNLNFETDSHNKILFELSPQVRINGELFCNGKVIVSYQEI